ncbi:hypothetical protein D3C78_975290 [compost metagenome]
MKYMKFGNLAASVSLVLGSCGVVQGQESSSDDNYIHVGGYVRKRPANTPT